MSVLSNLNDKKTPGLYRAIRWFVWQLSPKYRLEGAEKLPDEPCVIVGNHSQMYGPIAGELYMPGKHCVWCAGEMMHREEVSAYAYQDFWSGKPKGIRWFYKILSHLITPLCVLIFNSAHTVPVYHDTRLITTFRESIAKLKEGYSMVIFPEHYDEHNNIVHDFQDKFVDLARFYYKKTGEALPFVPVYIAPKLATVTLPVSTIKKPGRSSALCRSMWRRGLTPSSSASRCAFARTRPLRRSGSGCAHT